MTSKELLLQDKPASAWWNGVTKNPDFQKIKLLARAHLVEWKDTTKQEGALDMLDLLETFAESLPAVRKPLTAGLKHDFKESITK